MQKIIQNVILFVSTISLASAGEAPKKVKKQKHSAKQIVHQIQNKADPYLGFRPETDPAKAKVKPGPVDGKNVGSERDDLITKQRLDVNRVSSPSGSDALRIP